MTGARDRGFTLLELVAVMAIFAVVALIGAKVVEQTLRSNDRLVELSEEAAGLSLGLALLRRDLKSALALDFVLPGGAAFPPLDAPAGAAEFSLTVGGAGSLTPQDPGFARVTWRLDPLAGVVYRQVWPVLEPANAQAASPEVAVFRGVRSLELQGFVADGGWTSGFPSAADPSPLPQALRVRMKHERLETLETLVTLR